MNIENIINELAEQVKHIEPVGKKLKFVLEDDVMLIDGTGEANKLSNKDAKADCTIFMSKETQS